VLRNVEVGIHLFLDGFVLRLHDVVGPLCDVVEVGVDQAVDLDLR
jgi:hypothetical protein